MPRACRSTAATVSPKRNVTARSRRWYLSDSMTSTSHMSSIPGRFSTTVTLLPSAANMDAYSMPITPAPTITMDRGTRSSDSTLSESMIVRPSNSTLAGRAGRVPVAMTMCSAVSSRSWPVISRRATVCGSTKRPTPAYRDTWLRESWLRMTSTSRPTTCRVRGVRSATVMSSLSR